MHLKWQKGSWDPNFLHKLSTFPQPGHVPACVCSHGPWLPGLPAVRAVMPPPMPISPQVNTTLPARTLLLGWGPYALLHLCAALMGTALIPPGLQVVRDPQCQCLGSLHFVSLLLSCLHDSLSSFEYPKFTGTVLVAQATWVAARCCLSLDEMTGQMARWDVPLGPGAEAVPRAMCSQTRHMDS